MNPIEFQGLTKRYKRLVAVDSLTASIQKGRITGFLGPNGSGKSTSLRCLLGLASPTAGTALVNGMRYAELDHPLSTIGAVLDNGGFNPALTGLQNLKVICTAASIPDARAEEFLQLVDLESAMHRRTKGYSLGMKQRLSLAAALLGDPGILILDEPTNGLDPIGIAWLRNFLRGLADSGTTILISSHQLAEMQHAIDDVLVIDKGTLIADGTLAEVTGGQSLEEAFFRLVGGAK